MEPIEKQNDMLKDLLRLVVELLPKHSVDCGVHRAHWTYGDKYCNCNLKKFRETIREKLN